MAQGIQLAGGFGAGGVRDALVDLIAQRMAQADFDERQRSRMAAEDQARQELSQRRSEMNTRAERESAALAFNQKAHGEELGLKVKDQELRARDLDLRGRPEKPRTMTIRGVRDPKTGKPTTRVVTEDEAIGQTFEEYEAPREPRAPREERLVQIAGPDGSAMWVRESQAEGKPAAQAARSVTGSERQTLSFYNRAKEASDMLAQGDLEGRIAQQNTLGQLWGQYAPNIAQTKDQQLYRQAQRAFTEARLRKESGAAIPDAEYASDANTYFAQPGDSKETIAQKQQARQAVLEGLKFSAGRAYEEFYGEPGAASSSGTSGAWELYQQRRKGGK